MGGMANGLNRVRILAPAAFPDEAALHARSLHRSRHDQHNRRAAIVHAAIAPCLKDTRLLRHRGISVALEVQPVVPLSGQLEAPGRTSVLREAVAQQYPLGTDILRSCGGFDTMEA